MLKTLDILLGLSIVMLMVSLIVTVLTEAVTNLLQSRGKHLHEGLASLLQQIDRDLPEATTRAIATAILTHPMIKAAGSRYGTVIHREELTKLILELAADEGPQRLQADARAQLNAMLKRNGLEDPEGTLERVRAMALELERTKPELSNNLRYSIAFLHNAESRFLARLNGWFDQTVDRVSDRFTRFTRIVTFGGSLLVALLLQLDTAELVNRLSVDSTLRGALVQEAMKAKEELGAKQPGAGAPGSVQSTGAPGSAQSTRVVRAEGGDLSIPSLREEEKQHLQQLVRDDVIEFPQSLSGWTGRWSRDNWLLKLLGIVLTAMLLSLGAPFWYNALKNIVRLRSLVAQNDDKQRETRQSNKLLPADVEARVAGTRAASATSKVDQ